MFAKKFFKNLWRVNAIVILIAGLMLCAVLGVTGVMMLSGPDREPPVDHVANAAVGDIKTTSAQLGSFEAIPGSAVMRAPLTVEPSSNYGPSYKESAAVRNYLYFDPALRASYWLRPSMKGFIESSIALPSAETGEKKPNAVVYVHLISESDAGMESNANKPSPKQIAITTPEGKDFRIAVKTADRINKAMLVAPNQLLILYSVGQKLEAAEVDLSNRETPVKQYDVPTAPK